MADKEKVRVMFYASNPAATYGTSKVAKEIGFKLAKDPTFEVHFVSPDYLGIPYKAHGVNVLPVHPFQKGSKEWLSTLTSYINYIKPHVMIPFTDAFLLYDDGLHNLEFKDSHTRMLAYLNLDSITIPETGNDFHKKCHRIIVSSYYSQDQYKQENIDAEVIWHGVDITKFKKDDKRRIEMRKELGLEEDDFVFIAIGRNSPRKNWGALLLSFSKMCYKYDNVKLVLHMSDAHELRRNWIDFVNRTCTKYTPDNKNPVGDKKIIFLDKAKRMGKGVEESYVTGLYQMADAYVSSSNGEGFGLCYVEAMASEIPVIVPNNTTSPELIGKAFDDKIGPRGWIVPCSYNYGIGMSAMHELVDQDELQKAMEKCIAAPKDVRDTMGKNGREFCQKHLDWQDKVEQFKKIILEEHKLSLETKEALEQKKALSNKVMQ